ncbi:hypothetical protein BS78_02G334500 [Paspalum vaginatum]|nr:hypothetical protein BS78_02G334500 [Paspalum vaginatum]
MASLVYDIYIEPHNPDRVMRQFGYAQQFPVPRVIDWVSQQDHRLSRLGQPCSSTWVHKSVVHPVGPHTEEWYQAFLTWYRPRTRCHVTYADTEPVPHEASSTDAYARHRDEALAGAMQICCQLQSSTHEALLRIQGGNPFSPNKQLQRLTAANESILSMMHACGVSPTLQGPAAQQPPISPQYTGIQDQALNFSDMEDEQQHILGASQLGGAPLFATQDATQTPAEQTRPHREHRSPDSLTYSVGYVHAQQRPKRDRTCREGWLC